MQVDYTDEQYLRDRYVDKGWTLKEIGDEAGCHFNTVKRWMEKHGIERRRRGTHQVKPHAYLTSLPSGYEYWHDGQAGGTSRDVVYVHRLLAVAQHGFYAVTPDVDVHHKNGVPWDNRPENIELLDHAEHASVHADCRGQPA